MRHSHLEHCPSRIVCPCHHVALPPDRDGSLWITPFSPERVLGLFFAWVPEADTQQNNFAVEVIDETGHTVLVVPFREAEEHKSH